MTKPLTHPNKSHPGKAGPKSRPPTVRVVVCLSHQTAEWLRKQPRRSRSKYVEDALRWYRTVHEYARRPNAFDVVNAQITAEINKERKRLSENDKEPLDLI